MILRKEIDVIILKHALSVFRFTGIFPLMGRCLKFLLMTSNMTGIICFLTWDFLYRYSLSTTGLLLNRFELMVLVIFNVLCLKDIFTTKTLWNSFLSDVEAFDYEIMDQNFNRGENVFRYHIKCALGPILCSIFYTYDIVSFGIIKKYFRLISTTYFHYMLLQMFVTILVLQLIFTILSKRYEFLKRKTITIYQSSEQTFGSATKLKNAHFLLTNISTTVNKLFGSKILIILSTAFLDVIAGFQMVMLEDLGNVDLGNKLKIHIETTQSVVSKRGVSCTV